LAKIFNFYFKPLNIFKCLSFNLVFVRMDLNLAELLIVASMEDGW